MSSFSLLASVAAVHLAAMASPGPNVLLVAQTAMARSRRAALAAALGVASGAAVLATASALGLGLVVAHASGLRQALQVAGGLYLVWLGSRIWRSAPEPLVVGDLPRAAVRGDYVRGLLTNLTNPKAAVFYGSILAAVLVPADSGWVRAAAVAVIAANAVWWHCMIAVVFARPAVQRRYRRVKRPLDRVVGAALALLGAGFALRSPA